MDISISDVTVHINETLDAAQLDALDTALRELKGVVSVRFQTDNPHLAMVSYDPDRTTSRKILELVSDHPFGGHADLIPKKALHAQMVGL